MMRRVCLNGEKKAAMTAIRELTEALKTDFLLLPLKMCEHLVINRKPPARREVNPSKYLLVCERRRPFLL